MPSKNAPCPTGRLRRYWRKKNEIKDFVNPFDFISSLENNLADRRCKTPPNVREPPFKPIVGQNIALHASYTARYFFFEPISTFQVQSPSLFPKKPSPGFFLCQLWLTRVAVWARRLLNRSPCSSLSQTTDAGSRVERPRSKHVTNCAL